ncbi:MAG: hypothetical protein LBF86_00595 [Helicobacteraceae bacterium]|jgi:cell division protein FtsB|nr:hypothetical protein [Helicobacteraceae bacterium]
MRRVIITLLFASLALADDRHVSQRDFANFYLSEKAKEEFKAEIIADLNLSFESAKAELLNMVKSENERLRQLRATQNDELFSVISKLKDEVEFIRELAVDANYMRNSNDDIIAGLQKRIDELSERVKALEATINNKEPQPEIPTGGRKL